MRLLIGVSLLVLVAAPPAQAGTIEVGPGQNIQDALNRAKPGDTVAVAPGTYAPFQIKRDGITVKSVQPGGAHVIAKGDNEPAIGSYGQSDVSIIGFRLTSERGDGMKVTGSPSRMVNNLRVEGNVIESAWLDGIKMSHAERSTVSGNTIKSAGVSGPAGKGNNGNGDGGIDWVRVHNSEMIGNEVSTNGWACAMVKNGSSKNRIANNRFLRCEVNGVDMAAPSTGAAAEANKSGMVAYNNTVENNEIAGGRGCVVKLHETSRNNRLVGNRTSGRDCGDPNGTNHESATGDLGSSDPGQERTPLPRREDVPKVALPDNSKQQTEANAAVAKLATARQVLAQATATKLPSMSMSELRQNISDKNKANCN